MSLKELEQTSSKIAIFRGKQIRKIIYQGEWYFSIIDVIGVLTESTYANRYWSDLLKKLSDAGGSQKQWLPDAARIQVFGRVRYNELREPGTDF